MSVHHWGNMTAVWKGSKFLHCAYRTVKRNVSGMSWNIFFFGEKGKQQNSYTGHYVRNLLYKLEVKRILSINACIRFAMSVRWLACHLFILSSSWFKCPFSFLLDSCLLAPGLQTRTNRSHQPSEEHNDNHPQRQPLESAHSSSALLLYTHWLCCISISFQAIPTSPVHLARMHMEE